jgi:hypothetical protein
VVEVFEPGIQFFQANFLAAISEKPAFEIQSEIDQNLMKAKWRLRMDWFGFGYQKISLWQKGDLELYIGSWDNLNSEMIREFNLRFGFVDLEPGNSLFIAYILDSSQPLIDTAATSNAENLTAQVTVEAAAQSATQTAQNLEVELATQQAEQTQTAMLAQTAVAATQIASITPSPTSDPNPELLLPFSDSFDQGMKLDWRVLGSESPVLIDGKLTATKNGKISIEIGNGNLNDYWLEFDLKCDDKSGDLTIFFTPTLSLKVNPKLFNLSYLTWSEFTEDKWENFAEQRSDILYSCKSQRITIKRCGDNYEIFMDGALLHTLKYGITGGAPIIFQIQESDITIDNILIKRLN